MSFADLAQKFAGGELTPRENLERHIALIEKLEPSVQAFVYLNVEAARKAADESGQRYERGRPLSPIDGLPVGIKDMYETADMPTQMGSALFAGRSTGRDTPVVHALRAGGAIMLGKTVTTEFGFYSPGPTRNPHDLERTPGGSSSGSAAAVAAGFVPVSVAGQVVGSLIRPSSYCGIFGLKPTLGALNRGGSTLSQVCTGLMADNLDDLWAATFQIGSVGGADAGYPGLFGPPRLGPALRPTRAIVLETKGWAKTNPGAKERFNALIGALRDSGCLCLDRSDDHRIEALEQKLGPALDVTHQICGYEQQWPLGYYLDRFPEKITSNLTRTLTEWAKVTRDDYRRALAAREDLRKAHAQLAGIADFMITLSAPDVAPAGLDSTGDPVFAVTSSVLGAPALSLPLIDVDGLPVGVQVIGQMHEDSQLLRFGRWLWDNLQGGRANPGNA